MMCLTASPNVVREATASRSMSPVDNCGISNRVTIRVACVPFPAPGGPSKTSLINPVLPAQSIDLLVLLRSPRLVFPIRLTCKDKIRFYRDFVFDPPEARGNKSDAVVSTEFPPLGRSDGVVTVDGGNMAGFERLIRHPTRHCMA
jgi:hypothetical protein